AFMLGDALAQNAISLQGTASLSPTAEKLDGRVSLELEAREPVFDVRVYARAQGDKVLIKRFDYWAPDTRKSFALGIPSAHHFPGAYHLMVELSFRDPAGASHGVALAFDYRVNGAAVDTEESQPLRVFLTDDRVFWALGSADISHARLTLTTEPSWRMREPITPPATRIVLDRTGDRSAIAAWTYHQKARLEWLQGGIHHSRILDWDLRTDSAGNWPPAIEGPTAPWWRSPVWLLSIAGSFFLIGLLMVHRNRSLRPGSREWSRTLEEGIGGVAVVTLCAWTVSHAAPGLWFVETWATGGDVAAHVFYAKTFMDWLPHGKISGWLPESFAGFPAVTFYFPLPFSIAGLLQFTVSQPVAFKLASMLPAFLLPLGTYLLCRTWGWRVPIRLMAAAGVTGFIAGDATSIWGGNILAQLAGEFAYSWGLLLTTLFWAALSLALRRGGRWWLAAGVLEALVALSHGYALLVAGFGAFVYLLVSQNFRRDLRLVLQVHTLAFLLIGFWLIPLGENLPWTIPNDTSTAIESWTVLWPSSLWPMALGWFPLAWLLTHPRQRRGHRLGSVPHRPGRRNGLRRRPAGGAGRLVGTPSEPGRSMERMEPVRLRTQTDVAALPGDGDVESRRPGGPAPGLRARSREQ
ncbi:MAG: 6-pyruvoyl-tetrahydropterin synthase-related protein, partial [Xanthomonadales bacterium]